MLGDEEYIMLEHAYEWYPIPCPPLILQQCVVDRGFTLSQAIAAMWFLIDLGWLKMTPDLKLVASENKPEGYKPIDKS